MTNGNKEPLRCKECSESFETPGDAAWHWEKTGHRIRKPPKRFLKGGD